jgi:transposase
MKEEFLHYLWKYSLYDQDRLFDNEKNKIIVLDPGEYNRDSGPDFFNARISVAGTIWAGNVEVHIKSSHFDIHGHQYDPAFNNVILHVVAENDKHVFNARGEEVLTTELSFDSSYYEKYIFLVYNPYIIACQEEINKIDEILVRQWLNSLVIERFLAKTESILKIFSETGKDWEETFYRMLSRYFGFRVNTEPFEMLAAALPFRIIRKHSDNIFQIEALLYGTAGFLETGLFKEALTDEYYRNLLKEYTVLSAKYSLQPLHGWLWKFSRLRPSNFPTVRLSQLAAMLAVAGGLFSKVLEAEDINQIKKLFEVSASGYWDDHFVFGRKSRHLTKSTGSQATDIILINAVIPMIFVYGQSRDCQDICEKALSFLEKVNPEDNKITSEWKAAGITADSAFYSQALIQLRNEYCKKRKCLDCRIGNMIISQGKKLKAREELLLEP